MWHVIVTGIQSTELNRACVLLLRQSRCDILVAVLCRNQVPRGMHVGPEEPGAVECYPMRTDVDLIANFSSSDPFLDQLRTLNRTASITVRYPDYRVDFAANPEMNGVSPTSLKFPESLDLFLTLSLTHSISHSLTRSRARLRCMDVRTSRSRQYL